MAITIAKLGSMIREARKKQGLSQDDVAGLAGVGRRLVSEIERGKPTAHIGKVFLIMEIVGIQLSAHYFWDKTDDTTVQKTDYNAQQMEVLEAKIAGQKALIEQLKGQGG